MHQQTALSTALLSLESFGPRGDLLQQDLDRLVRTVPWLVISTLIGFGRFDRAELGYKMDVFDI